jgi:hypothetical protein
MNIQTATAHGIQNTSTSLLGLLDYWECIINLKNKSAQHGCLPIEQATGEIQPGDVFIITGEHTSYYDAIARALAVNTLNAGGRTLFVGSRAMVRHFMCELVAREVSLPLSQVMKAQFSDEQWLQVHRVMEGVKKQNSLFTAIVTDTYFDHYLKLLNQALTDNADIELVCIEGVSDYSWQSSSGFIAQRLKAWALRHRVAVVIAVEVTHNTTDIRVPECLPPYWGAPDFTDGILLCEQHKPNTIGLRTCPRSVDVRYDSRMGAGHLNVALSHDGIGRVDVSPLVDTNNDEEK